MADIKKSKGLSLYQKLLQIQSRVGPARKSGYNEYHKYKYAKLADYHEQFEPLLEEFGLILLTDSGEQRVLPNGNVGVYLTIRLIDPETGEEIVTHCPGEGIDPNDKGTYKAITGGRKYGVAFLFNMLTIDDPEDVKGDPKNQMTAAQRIAAAKTRNEENKEEAAELGTTPHNLVQLCEEAEKHLEELGVKGFNRRTLNASRKKMLGSLALNRAPVQKIAEYYNQLQALVKSATEGK